MAETLLETKLHIPSTRPAMVSRQRLVEDLNKGLHRKLTLISAPAGFGKTTLVTEWLKGEVEDQYRVAWLSLDEDENDPVRFLSYFITAMIKTDGLEVNFGNSMLSMLKSSQRVSADAVLPLLINELSTIPGKILLVLDDYHVISVQQVHDAVAYFLEHIPPQVHLVIISRENPPLQLARFRASDQINELRAADLRFTYDEASEFLNDVMKLKLTMLDIKALNARTEGWVTGLQLAGISLRGREDPSQFIESFSGSHRFVLDYLIEEVLYQQTDKIRSFLLKTSILERLTGPLCDALTNQTNGRSTLEKLEHANLFIIPLDEERRWYRYHHLFSELLHQRLKQTKPEELTTLHQKAIEWYEQNGLIDEAIDHALRAKYYEQASQLIGKHVDTLWAHGEYAKLRRWLAGLPEEQVLSRPQLAIFKAWIYFASGRLDVAIKFLQEAEIISSHGSNQSSEAQSQEQFPSSSELEVLGRAADFQAWMAAYMRGNVSGMINHLCQVLANIPENDMHWRGAVAIILAEAYAFNGNLPESYRARLETLRACEATGNTYLYIYNSAKLALNLKIQGQLLHVQELCQQRMQFAKDKGLSTTAAAGWLLAIWSESLAEMNKLDEASALVEKSLILTEHGGDADILGWSYLSLIRILFALGDMAGAEENTQKIFRLAHEFILPTWIIHLNAGWRSRIWLAQGKIETAMQWVNERNFDVTKSYFYLDGLEHIGIARVYLHQGKWNESIVILDRLLEPARVGGDITREIELLILKALALYSGEKTNRALESLEKALNIGEPQGFCRIFVDEGTIMANLLYEALSRGIAPDFIRRLLAIIPIEESRDSGIWKAHQPDDELIEALSEREIEVLQLINDGLTNQDIAARLFLSLHTVKAHIRNIYSKLDVHNRIQAIARAKVLGILKSI